MVTILLFALIGIAIGIYEARKVYRCDSTDYIFYSFFGIIVGGLIGLGVSICAPLQTYVHRQSLELQNIQDGSGVNGRFFLGSGIIENRMQYVFYYKDGDGYRMTQTDMDYTLVKYTDGQPKVTVTSIELKDTWINLFAIDLVNHRQTFVIEVPRGTIKSNYNLDAQ